MAISMFSTKYRSPQTKPTNINISNQVPCALLLVLLLRAAAADLLLSPAGCRWNVDKKEFGSNLDSPALAELVTGLLKVVEVAAAILLISSLSIVIANKTDAKPIK